MNNKSKELIDEINELLAQDTIPVYDIESDEVEILSETVEIISTADAEYEIIEYKFDDEDIVEVTQPGEARRAEGSDLIRQANELSNMLDQQEAQLNENRNQDELNNNESKSGKTSTLSSDQIIYSMTETESESEPQACGKIKTSIFDHQLLDQYTKLSAGHRGVNIKTNKSKEWVQIGILGKLKISNPVF